MDEDEIITNPFEDAEDELEEDTTIYRTADSPICLFDL